MGLHNPLGYVGYETRFANLFIYLIDNFCGGCHSNEKCGGCGNCKIGQLAYAAKDYIVDAHEPSRKHSQRALKKIKKEIKHIELEPLMLSSYIGQRTRTPDPLLKLREYVKDYEFLENQQLHGLMIKHNYLEDLNKIMEYMLGEDPQ